MQKVFIVVALVGVLVSGPASADEFPPGMDWLMNKPLSFWDWGIYQYDNNQHESAKKKLSWMLGGKKVSGGFMWWDTDLRANYFVYEVKGNLNNRCLEIWALAKETVWPKHDQQSKKHGMKSFGDSLAFNFTPRSYIFRDQPKTLGSELINL